MTTIQLEPASAHVDPVTPQQLREVANQLARLNLASRARLLLKSKVASKADRQKLRQLLTSLEAPPDQGASAAPTSKPTE